MSEEKFLAAVKLVLRHEGRFTNNKADPGGATMYGISLRFLKAAGIDIDLDGDVDIYDILALTRDDAEAIYKKHWWDRYYYEDINSKAVSTKIFDLAINMGAKQAHKIAQSAANALGHRLARDGILGHKSLYAINSLSSMYEESLIRSINKYAKEFYYTIVERNPEYSIFLRGWLNRVNDKAP